MRVMGTVLLLIGLALVLLGLALDSTVPGVTGGRSHNLPAAHQQWIVLMLGAVAFLAGCVLLAAGGVVDAIERMRREFRSGAPSAAAPGANQPRQKGIDHVEPLLSRSHVFRG